MAMFQRKTTPASSSLLSSSHSASTAALETSKQTQAPVSLLTSPTTTDTSTDVSESECDSRADNDEHTHKHEHKHGDDTERCSREPKLCLCEVRRHTTEASCWLVVDQRVYDVTGVLRVHPGGARSILRKAGGVDCASDMAFHARRARKTLDACLVGKLERCGDTSSARESSGCCIM